MRQAIASAEVADEQRLADPTTNRLQERVAGAARPGGGAVPPERHDVQPDLVPPARAPGRRRADPRPQRAPDHRRGGRARPERAADDPRARRRRRDLHAPSSWPRRSATRSRYLPRSRVVSVEQTTNMGGGRVWPLERVREVLEVAREHGLRAHMDGARLMNAVVASGTSAAEFAGGFDTAWIDFTKGLGAPVGAVLAGLARADRRGVALEAADGRRVPPVGHRRRRLPARARPPRRAARRGSRERARARGRARRARLRGDPARDEHRDLQRARTGSSSGWPSAGSS